MVMKNRPMMVVQHQKSIISILFLLSLSILNYPFTKGELSTATLLSSNYTVKRGVDLLGGKIDLVSGELVFDRPLYRLSSSVCTNDTACVPPSCPPCDYTNNNPNGCGVVDPSCPLSFTCPLASQLCNGSSPYNDYQTITQFNTPLKFVSPGTDWMDSISRFRFYIGSTCQGYKFRLTILEGDLLSANFYINPANNTKKHQFTNMQRDLTVTMCPSDKRYIDGDPSQIELGNFGTQFFDITNISPNNVTYIIQIDTFDLNQISSPTPTCQPVVPGIQCLNNGMNLPDTDTVLTTPRTYSFTIDKCENITIQHQYSTSYPDVYVKIDDPSVSNVSFDYYSPGSTHEQLTFQLCGQKIIFIALYPLVQGIKPTVFVSTNAIMQATPLAQAPSIQSGTWMLAGTSSIRLNDTKTLGCNSFGVDCYQYIPSAPRYFTTPLYPVPDILLNQSLSEFQHLEMEEVSNPLISNRYQFGIIISSKYYEYTISNDSWINDFIFDGSNVMIRLLDNLVDEQGNVIGGNYSIGNSKVAQCSYTAFQEIQKEQEGIAQTIQDSPSARVVHRLRYQFDLLMIRDSYFLCELLAQEMLQLTHTHKIGNTTVCLDPNNRLDPCCTFSALYNHSCGPTLAELDRIELDSVLEDLVSEKCASPTCVTSLLGDYAQTYLGRQSSACSVEQKEVYDSSDPTYNLFRICHQNTTMGIKCQQDSDCQQSLFGNSSKCNPRDGLCQAPYQMIERAFVTCLVKVLPPSTLVDFLAKYNISQDDNDTMISFTHNKFSQQLDCVTPYTIDKNTRQSYRYVTSDGTVPSYCYRGIHSIDRSDVLQSYDTCYQGNERFMWSSETLPQNCDNYYKCDWMGSQGTLDAFQGDVNNLQAACNSPSKPLGFCGECDTDPTRNCYIDNTLDQTTCPQKFACYHPISVNPMDPNPATTFTQPNQAFETTNSEVECQTLHGSCNIPCGLRCSPRQSCVVPLTTTASCSSTLFSGATLEQQVTVDSTTYCSYYSTGGSLTQAQCEAESGVFTNCNSFNSLNQVDLINQCGVCGSTTNFTACACKLDPIPCKTLQECKNAGGLCSDNLYFTNKIAGYPPGQPKCIFGDPKVIDPSRIAMLPQCVYGKEQESPVGCFSIDPTMVRPGACVAAGGILWSPATNQNQCTVQYPERCFSVDRSQSYIPPLSRRYMDKPQDDCTGKVLGDAWRPTFQWIRWQWTNGTAVPLSWQTTQGMVPITIYNNSFSYQQMFDAFQAATVKKLALSFKSEMLCRSSLGKSTLIPFSCSCGVDRDQHDTDACFDVQNDDPIDTIIKPCTLDDSSFPLGDDEGSKGNITFSLGSVRGYICVSIGIGQIYSDSLKAKQVVALSSDFVPSMAPGDYSVFNQKGGVIGKALADGLILKIFDRGINNFDLCINQTISSSSDFPDIYDFAILQNERDGVVTPLECDTTRGETAVCCNIKTSSLPVPVGTNKLLLIQRVNAWKKQSYQAISSSNQAVVYTLGAIFLVPFVIGSIEIIYHIYAHFFNKAETKVVHILFIFLTLFSIIRGIYFFILGSAVLRDNANANVTDYILVVLPTFLYFTAFTIVIIIWYILSRDSMKRVDNIYKRINRLIVGVNILLYLLFIGIVLVFNFYIGDPPPTCGGRVLAGYENSTPQRVVSILYASVQAVLSLGLGISFIYYGRKVIQKLSHFKSNLANANNQMKKTVSMAIICSVGFLLHCIFIIVLVTVKPKNVIFSFIGLLVTEIIPVMTLLVTYSQLPISLTGIFFKDKLLKDGASGVELQSTSTGSSSSSGSKTRTTTLSSASH